MSSCSQRRNRGFTLVEMTTVLAVSGILLASTIPLGSYWTQKAKMADATGELTHSIGKAIGSALRNPNALDADVAIAAVCISPDNEVTVLEANVGTPIDCTNGNGNTLKTGTLPPGLEITRFGQTQNCLCFNSSALLTNNNQCSTCSTNATLDLTVGSQTYSLHVQ